jgi:hypothetical protein
VGRMKGMGGDKQPWLAFAAAMGSNAKWVQSSIFERIIVDSIRSVAIPEATKLGHRLAISENTDPSRYARQSILLESHRRSV